MSRQTLEMDKRARAQLSKAVQYLNKTASGRLNNTAKDIAGRAAGAMAKAAELSGWRVGRLAAFAHLTPHQINILRRAPLRSMLMKRFCAHLYDLDETGNNEFIKAMTDPLSPISMLHGEGPLLAMLRLAAEFVPDDAVPMLTREAEKFVSDQPSPWPVTELKSGAIITDRDGQQYMLVHPEDQPGIQLGTAAHRAIEATIEVEEDVDKPREPWD